MSVSAWILLIGVFTAWLLIIIIQALIFRPHQGKSCPMPAFEPPAQVDKMKAAEHLAKLISCRTVDPLKDEGDLSSGSFAEFEKFRSFLPEFYPLVHKDLAHELINGHSMLYHWPGRNKNKPLVLMAHYDVVPADLKQWSKPPFAGLIEEELIWGRGALDTKSTLCGIFEAVEALLAVGYKPDQDVYLAFGHDEETMGSGAPSIVEVLRERGVSPALVLDEGGAIVENMFPGIKKPIAVVGMAEKGVADLEVVIEGSGGHSSTPGRLNPLTTLSKIILQVDRNPFKASLPVEVKEMFDLLGRQMPFSYRLLFANLWCFKPLLLKLLPLISRELNALCRTTAIFTIVEAGSASNVIPEKVRAVANLRLAAADPLEKALQHISNLAMSASKKARQTADQLKVSVQVVHGHNASPSSPTSSPEYRKLVETIEAKFENTIVTPYIMLGASDARHFCAICDNVMRFSPIRMSKEELRSIHGHDEGITVDKLETIIHFYISLISRPY